MPAKCVVGLQWGDEGKGKILDYMAENADLIIRYQGGANAGHTVVANGSEYIFHLIPSGILHAGKLNIISNGVVLDPGGFIKEMDAFIARGVEIKDNLLISSRAHMVMPYHLAFDEAEEKNRSAEIGTTRRGIGPCYMDKMARIGFRMMDLVDFDRFAEKLKEILPMKNRVLTGAMDSVPVSEKKILDEFETHSKRLATFITDTGPVVRKALKEDRSVLFEGAQGAMLDIDHGTYPFVTSSNSCAVGIPAGAGVSPHAVGEMLGVVKAYTTRVGGGPFPTEECDAQGEFFRDRGNEYGATTGRPRRCGWLDGVALRYVVDLNGIQGLAVTKLDVLSGFGVVKVCTAYHTPGRRFTEFPADTETLVSVEPEYKEFPGWQEDITGAREFQELPDNARDYLAAVAEIAGAPVVMVSVGPGREQTIFNTSSSSMQVSGSSAS